jgi:hypothetical protein
VTGALVVFVRLLKSLFKKAEQSVRGWRESIFSLSLALPCSISLSSLLREFMNPEHRARALRKPRQREDEESVQATLSPALNQRDEQYVLPSQNNFLFSSFHSLSLLLCAMKPEKSRPRIIIPHFVSFRRSISRIPRHLYGNYFDLESFFPLPFSVLIKINLQLRRPFPLPTGSAAFAFASSSHTVSVNRNVHSSPLLRRQAPHASGVY